MIDYLSIFNAYEQMFGQDTKLSTLRDQIDAGEDIINRKNMHGHCCADAMIFNTDYTKMLLIYHTLLGIYIQPGGHIDDMIEHPWIHAQREAVEETGVVGITLHPRHHVHGYIPLSIKKVVVPLNLPKGEGEHGHYNMCYVFVADETIPLPLVDDDGTSNAHRESIYTLNTIMKGRTQTIFDRLGLPIHL